MGTKLQFNAIQTTEITHPDDGLAKRFLLADGTTVPVEDADEVEDESSWMSSASSKFNGGASGGSLASRDFTNSF